MTTIRRHLDVLLGLAGTVGTLAAVTILAGWPFALLVGSLAAVGVSMVVPTWD